jgi:hypothetical protein
MRVSNWALVYNGARDYPANVRGNTYGVAFDYNQDFLKVPVRIVEKGCCRHDGKEAVRMGRNEPGRRQGSPSDQIDDLPGSTKPVKVTLHLTVGTAQRLGVESAMRRISQSAIAEEVLAAYLSRWQLPAVTDPHRLEAG